MKDERLYLIHIRECIDKIERYVAGSSRVTFESSGILQDAVIRNLQVLAESTQRLSASTRERHPDVDWTGIAGLRNVLVHDYLGLDLERVWNVIEHDLPGLSMAINNLMGQDQ